MRHLAQEHHSPITCAYHYLHMARRNYRDYLQGTSVWRKKYLYALRPLLAVRWIERGLGLVSPETGPIGGCPRRLPPSRIGDLHV